MKNKFIEIQSCDKIYVDNFGFNSEQNLFKATYAEIMSMFNNSFVLDGKKVTIFACASERIWR